MYTQQTQQTPQHNLEQKEDIMKNITQELQDSPLYKKLSIQQQVEALRYYRHTLALSGIIVEEVTPIRRKIAATCGEKFVANNEKLCQDLAEDLRRYRCQH